MVNFDELSGNKAVPTSESSQQDTRVHNHGPDEDRGIDCPEKRMPDGYLKGACMLKTMQTEWEESAQHNFRRANSAEAEVEKLRTELERVKHERDELSTAVQALIDKWAGWRYDPLSITDLYVRGCDDQLRDCTFYLRSVLKSYDFIAKI